MAQVDAYFEAVRDTIGDVLACMPELDHPYLEAKDARQAGGAEEKTDTDMRISLSRQTKGWQALIT